MLEGYAESQHVILGLNKEHPVYLKQGSQKIQLVVKEILVGDFYLTQALLTPADTLMPGKEYELVIDSLPTYESPITRWDPLTKTYQPIRWTVSPETDVTKPLWKSKPVETKKSLVYYGCGPATYVHFFCNVQDQSSVLIKTSVTNLKTKKVTSYYLIPNDTTIRIGHGMCSGAFEFDETDSYEVSFDLMDACGNLTPWTEKKILFTKPTRQTHDE